MQLTHEQTDNALSNAYRCPLVQNLPKIGGQVDFVGYFFSGQAAKLAFGASIQVTRVEKSGFRSDLSLSPQVTALAMRATHEKADHALSDAYRCPLVRKSFFEKIKSLDKLKSLDILLSANLVHQDRTRPSMDKPFYRLSTCPPTGGSASLEFGPSPKGRGAPKTGERPL